MKFIVDAHLPKKLSDFLTWKGYDSIHTLNLPNGNKSKDSEINTLSLNEKRVLISKDLDFVESLIISKKPYKLITISAGNISNKQLIEIFKQNIDYIVLALKETRFIEITNQKIIIK